MTSTSTQPGGTLRVSAAVIEKMVVTAAQHVERVIDVLGVTLRGWTGADTESVGDAAVDTELDIDVRVTAELGACIPEVADAIRKAVGELLGSEAAILPRTVNVLVADLYLADHSPR